MSIALLRANARKAGITDIRQKASEVYFTLRSLNIDAVSELCAEPDYKQRVQFIASAKEPTLRLKLATGINSLKQSEVFIQHYQQYLS